MHNVAIKNLEWEIRRNPQGIYFCKATKFYQSMINATGMRHLKNQRNRIRCTLSI